MLVDVVWSYLGVWLLLDDSVVNVLVIMCDYLVECEIGVDGIGVLFVNVWGGKIMIYCKLVEEVLDQLVLYLLLVGKFLWIVIVLLLGGDLEVLGQLVVEYIFDDFVMCL